MRVTLSPCSKEPCVIVRGKTIRVEIEFVAVNICSPMLQIAMPTNIQSTLNMSGLLWRVASHRDIATELPEIRGSSGHGPQVLQFPEGGICAHLSPSCPIKARKFYALLYRPRVNLQSR
ncbi:hypothetical protein X801_04106, partial [Opisthorchis viverrini]